MSTFEVRVLNADGTRSTTINQEQLNVVTEVLNSIYPRKKFNEIVLQKLIEKGLAPDFNDANSREEPVKKGRKK